MIAYIIAHKAAILAVIVALDTALAAIPSVEANSTFQMVTNFIKKFFPAAPAA